MLWWWRREFRILYEQISLAMRGPRAKIAVYLRDTFDYYATAKNGVRNLEDWLTIATRGLCDYARLRIREEVEEHFAEAVDSLITEACSESDATAIALSQLGSPKHARRLYRNEYLTKRESGAIEDFRDTMDPRFRFFGRDLQIENWQLALFLAPCMLMLLLSNSPIEGSWAQSATNVCLCGFVIFLLSADRVARFVTDSSSASFGYLMYRISVTLAGAFGAAAFGISAYAFQVLGQDATLTTGPLDALAFAYLALFFLPSVIREYKTWRKIRPMLSE